MSFNGKVVIVTGASSGIGAAIAIKFAEEGADVVIVGRNQTKLKNTYEKCTSFGNKPLTIVADVTKDNDVKRIVNDTIKQFAKIDILVNNAGIAGQASIDSDAAIEVYDRIITTNLRSVIVLTNLACKYIIKTKGNIINISSIAGLDVLAPGHFAYCTSKAGLDHFTRSAALDLAPKGIRVNSINPGPVITDIYKNYGGNITKEENYKSLQKITALERVSQPEEIADLVLFVASDKAKAITGSLLVTDNGTLVKRNKS